MNPPRESEDDATVGEREWLTKAEVTVLVREEISQFHKENLVKFDALFGAMHELKGAFKAGAWGIGVLLAVLAVVVAVLALKH